MKADKPEMIAAREAYAKAVRTGAGPTVVVDAVIKAYEAAKPAYDDRHISPMTRAMAALKVHDHCYLPDMAPQTINGRMITARKLMNNPDARWQRRRMDDGQWKIKRVPDNSRPTKEFSQRAMELGSMRVGQTIHSTTFTATRGKGQMGANHKVMARRYLGNPEADWTTKTVDGKVTVTRIK